MRAHYDKIFTEDAKRGISLQIGQWRHIQGYTLCKRASGNIDKDILFVKKGSGDIDKDILFVKGAAET